MYKKVLFAASSPYDLKHGLCPYMEHFLSNGWEVHVLTSGDFRFKGISRLFKLPLDHKPISWKSFQAVRKVRSLLKEQNYGLLHTYGPEAGFCVRMAAQNIRLKDTGVIHITNGYNFLDHPKNREEKSALLAERLCSGVTDVLMTMNETDFFLARHFRLCKSQLIKIPGLGITAKNYDLENIDRDLIRKKYWIDEEDRVFLCIGDFTPEHNQLFLIENLEPILTKFKKLKIIFCGNSGPTLNACKVAAGKNRLDDFIVFVEDTDKRKELFAIANYLIDSSLYSGMSPYLLEACEYSVPVLASRVKGHMDLIRDGKNGFLFNPTNSSELIGKMYSILDDPDLADIFIENAQDVAVDYMLDVVKDKLIPFYDFFMQDAADNPNPIPPLEDGDMDALDNSGEWKTAILEDPIDSKENAVQDSPIGSQDQGQDFSLDDMIHGESPNKEFTQFFHSNKEEIPITALNEQKEKEDSTVTPSLDETMIFSVIKDRQLLQEEQAEKTDSIIAKQESKPLS